jgi:hypothetical protein
MSEGDRAWLGLLLGVVIYDAWAVVTQRETLSQSFDRALRDPKRSGVTIAAWSALTMHLFDKSIRRTLGRVR